MSDTLTTIQGTPVLICAPDGKKLATESAAVELIGEALGSGTELIVVPVERLEDDFFQLKSGLLGQIIQKFVLYRRRLVILGDFSHYEANSRAFKDFVYETNRGNQVWFLPSLQALDESLSRPQ